MSRKSRLVTPPLFCFSSSFKCNKYLIRNGFGELPNNSDAAPLKWFQSPTDKNFDVYASWNILNWFPVDDSLLTQQQQKKKKKDSGNLFNFVLLLFSVSLLVSNRNSRFFPSLLILIVRRTMLKKNFKKELSSINPNRYLIRHQPVRHAVDDTRIWLIILSLKMTSHHFKVIN